MTTDTNNAESIADDRRLAQCVEAENAEIAADLQRMDDDLAYRTAVYREWREQRGQLQRSKRLHELAEERIEQLEAELARKRLAMAAQIGTVPPVVGHRFRLRNKSTVTIAQCEWDGASCIYMTAGGARYGDDGRRCSWLDGEPDWRDLIEDLGPAGGGA